MDITVAHPTGSSRSGRSAITRVVFVFAFTYFILASLQQFAIGSIALLHDRWLLNLWRQWSAVPSLWAATHLFRFHDFDPQLRVSDSVVGWSSLGLNVVGAAVVAAVWSVADRRRRDYTKALEWLRLTVRFGLGVVLLDYGAQKVFSVQMPLIRLHQLLGTFGSYAPGQLLWAFIGASRGYEMFTGCVELVAGVLLFIPRLTTLGALLGFAALTQVFALNVFYDIQVKRGSLELLISALFLLTPDIRRLADFFLLNRSTAPAVRRQLFDSARLANVAIAAQIVIGLALTANAMWYYYRFAPVTNVFDTTRVPFYGIWDVEEFMTSGVARPPLTTDDLRWQRIVFDDYYNTAFIQRMNGELVGVRSQTDATRSKVLFSYRGGMPSRQHALGPVDAEFTVQPQGPDSLVLRGKYNGADTSLTLRRSTVQFALQPHETRWILHRASTFAY